MLYSSLNLFAKLSPLEYLREIVDVAQQCFRVQGKTEKRIVGHGDRSLQVNVQHQLPRETVAGDKDYLQ